MENDLFGRRKTKISKLISEGDWEKASYLILSILNDNPDLQVEQNSWLLIKLLFVSINLKDLNQVQQVLNMRKKMVTSFTIADQITWQKLHYESLLMEGVDTNNTAIKLMKIWRELTQLLNSEQRHQELIDSCEKLLKSILKVKLNHYFWEPLLWWIYWSLNDPKINEPSLEYLVKAHKLNPNKWFLNYILERLSTADVDNANRINNQLQTHILDCNFVLPEKPSVFDLSQSAIKSIQNLNIDELEQLLRDGVPPQGLPHEGGVWWFNLQYTRNLDVVRILLEYGAWVNLSNHEGINSLMISVIQGDISLFNLLLRFGANPLVITPEKSNLLHLAVRSNQAEMVKQLLNFGLRAEWKDGYGRSAIDIALDLKLSEIIEIMMS